MINVHDWTMIVPVTDIFRWQFRLMKMKSDEETLAFFLLSFLKGKK